MIGSDANSDRLTVVWMAPVVEVIGDAVKAPSVVAAPMTVSPATLSMEALPLTDSMEPWEPLCRYQGLRLMPETR